MKRRKKERDPREQLYFDVTGKYPEGKEQMDQIMELFRQLPEVCKETMSQRYFQNKNYITLAREQGLTGTVVIARATEGLNRLRDLFNEAEKKAKARADELLQADAGRREAQAEALIKGITEAFPALSGVLPIAPQLEVMPVTDLRVSKDILVTLAGQFENMLELFRELRDNPGLKIRGLNDEKMLRVRKAMQRLTGLPLPGEEKDATKVSSRFPDYASIVPGNWSLTPIIMEYQRDRRLEIGLYREPDDGSYTLQIFDGDDVIFCQTVDAGLLIEG